ncbi:MAG: 50S ribosomal protein L11 [Deltaproteobacteria bacterium]|nr:50S ribosomal protein L11 [Deltaproteobacteria bacterium]
MAKKVASIVKLQIPAGKASPAPPVGTALGPRGVNIMGFCKDFNDRTKNQAGSILPTVISIYADKTFSFITKSPPASDLLKKAAKVEKGSQTPGTAASGTVTKQQVKEIAELKMKDLNAYDIDAAMKIIMGSARSMGLTVAE